MKDITVLITAAANAYMPGTTACLKHNGEREIRLIGADMNDDPTMLEMVDAYYTVPRGDDPTYVDALFRICEKEKVDILLPVMSVELAALSKNKERFLKNNTIISVSDIEPLSIANNKLSLFNFLKVSHLPCPTYRSVQTVSEIQQAAFELGYPDKKVCIKAAAGSGSRGFRILDASQASSAAFFSEKPQSCSMTLEELSSVLSDCSHIPEMLVMEYLPGAEYTVDLLADQGKVLYNCCRKCISMDNSIMLDGVIVNDSDILDLCQRITERLGLDGNIGFDVKRRADGTPMIMECNPRITAGIMSFSAAGVNLPYLCIKKLLGEPLPEIDVRIGAKIKRRYCEMYF